MGVGVATDISAHYMATTTTWTLLSIPPNSEPFIQQLEGLNSLWEYQLTLCTFILTFFTSQAYSHWRAVYFTTRAVQGRINDVCLLLAVAAQRKESEGGSSSSSYDDAAEALLLRCTRLIRLSHTFFWAATPTRADGVADGFIDGKATGETESPKDTRGQDKFDDLGPLLLSSDGLDRLVAEEQLTRSEADALLASGLPPSQYPYVLLEWVGLYAMRGMEMGHLRASQGLEENFLRQLTQVRAEYFSIGDYTAGRMPLAYVQLVQVLVDSLVVLAPLALYPELGSLSIPLCGLLTLFFKGLLELSKSFLDPFGNEGYPYQNIRVDVLVSELNFGAGHRWAQAGKSLPE